ncbi:MAG: hypothetical protein NUV77_04190 [Thermoguttaceae bacterium]|jgi:hypothetical protein|nr:hypothetical protein [Thermoguttaceae bacterium]
MKAKVRLDPQAMKQFFLDHFEKVLFGLVALGFLLFVYRAVAREPLGFTPEDLLREAERAKTNLKNTQPTDVPKPPKYAEEAPRIRVPIPEDPYKVKPLAQEIFEKRAPRDKPEVFPIKDVRATAGHGAFQMLPPEDATAAPMMTASQVRGQRWVCVTGLIEHAKHYEAYKAAFEKAGHRDPVRDFPSYSFYRIERAEVDPQDPDADPSTLTWVRLHVANAMREAESRWASMAQEVVDQRYWPMNYTRMMFPLGPLVDRAWGPEVAHEPEITLAQVPQFGVEGGPEAAAGEKNGKAKQAKAGEDEAEPKDAAETPKTTTKKKTPKRPVRPRPSPDDPDEPDELGPAASPYGGMMPGSPMGAPRVRPTMPRMPSGYPGSMPSGYPSGSPGGSPSGYPGGYPGGSPEGGYPGGMVRPGMMGPGYSPDGYSGTYEEEYEPEEYLLFRFFDFSVEPGKQYRYRVRLLLDNPNQGMDPRTLASPDLATPRWLEAPWSAPSPVVAVPLDSQVWTVAATAKLSETIANVLVVHFNMETGMEASKKFDAPRGQWLNYLKQELEQPSMPGAMGGYPGMPGMPGSPMMSGSPGMPGEMPGMPGMPGMAPKAKGKAKAGATEEEEKQYVDYVTNCILLDVSGGGKLPGREKEKLTEPASILLFDKDGKLVVRNELDDLVEVSRYVEPEETTTGPVVGPTEPGGLVNPYEMYAPGGKGRKPAPKGKKGGASGYPGYPGGMPGYPAGSAGSPGEPGGSPSMMPGGYGYPGGSPVRGKAKTPARSPRDS